MGKQSSIRGGTRGSNLAYGVALARAFGGALLFSLPLIMTRDMWKLGATLDPLRLAQFLLVAFPVLVLLSHYLGFEATLDLREDILDVFVAYGVAVVNAALLLWLIAVIEPDTPLREIVGLVAIQAVPGAIGALLAQSQFGQHMHEVSQEGGMFSSGAYLSELFFMLVGALFLGMNIAPTEEMFVIAYQLSDWHALGLIVITLVVMHAFMYVVEFAGQEAMPEGKTQIGVFFHFTVVGYMIVLATSLYILWTFGSIDGLSLREVLLTMIVLGLPGGLGAAAARLLL